MKSKNCLIINTQGLYLELFNNFHGSGVSGCEIISEINGNSIFIPAAGYRNDDSIGGVDFSINIWASSNNGLSPDKAYSLSADMEDGFYMLWDNRCNGLPVRGVFK